MLGMMFASGPSPLFQAIPYLLPQIALILCSSASNVASSSSSTGPSTETSIIGPTTASLENLTSTASSIVSCATQSYAPVVFPIRNVTLSDSTIRRGVAFNVGSPPQPIAMIAEAFDNETYLYDGSTTNCNSSLSRLECSNTLGGFFNEGASSTWSQAASLPAIGEPFLNAYDSHTGDLFGTDSVKANTNLTLPAFPLGICRTGSKGGGANTVGLNNNSTLIRALLNSKAIASNTWSMYFGWVGAQTSEQLDGGIVFGGYDKAKIKDVDVNVTLPISYSNYQCPSGYVVQIQGMDLNLSNGSTVGILAPGSGTAFQACIDVSESSNTIGDDIWQRFVNISRMVPTYRATNPFTLWSWLVLADGAYDGDLTITVYPNLQIRIPNHQLVTPEITVNSQGQEYLKNTTERNVLINNLLPPNDKDIPRLGRPFLSSAYLYVNYERSEFTIWPSQPTVSQNLVSVGPPICSSASPISASSSSTSSPASTGVPQEGDGPSKGAIAGGVVGALVGVSICCGIIWLLCAKRRAHRKQALQDQRHAAAMDDLKRASDNSERSGGSILLYKPEMQADTHPPQELPLLRDSSHNSVPYEMSETSKVEAPTQDYQPIELPVLSRRKLSRAELAENTRQSPRPNVPAKGNVF